MRKLKSMRFPGMTVYEILDEFNERVDGFSIAESEIINIAVSPPLMGAKVATSKGVQESKVEVTIFYWADDA